MGWIMTAWGAICRGFGGYGIDEKSGGYIILVGVVQKGNLIKNANPNTKSHFAQGNVYETLKVS